MKKHLARCLLLAASVGVAACTSKPSLNTLVSEETGKKYEIVNTGTGTEGGPMQSLVFQYDEDNRPIGKDQAVGIGTLQGATQGALAGTGAAALTATGHWAAAHEIAQGMKGAAKRRRPNTTNIAVDGGVHSSSAAAEQTQKQQATSEGSAAKVGDIDNSASPIATATGGAGGGASANAGADAASGAAAESAVNCPFTTCGGS